MLLIFFCFAVNGHGVTFGKKNPQNLVLVPDNGSAIVIDKSKQKFYLYSSEHGAYNQKFVFPCSTGESSGIKSRAGDKKTPEGIYFITHHNPNSKYHLSLGISYPNAIDAENGLKKILLILKNLII